MAGATCGLAAQVKERRCADCCCTELHAFADMVSCKSGAVAAGVKMRIPRPAAAAIPDGYQPFYGLSFLYTYDIPCTGSPNPWLCILLDPLEVRVAALPPPPGCPSPGFPQGSGLQGKL